jgi:hypothetical protein
LSAPGQRTWWGLDDCHGGCEAGSAPPPMHLLEPCSPMLVEKRSHSTMCRNTTLLAKEEQSIDLSQDMFWCEGASVLQFAALSGYTRGAIATGKTHHHTLTDCCKTILNGKQSDSWPINDTCYSRLFRPLDLDSKSIWYNVLLSLYTRPLYAR